MKKNKVIIAAFSLLLVSGLISGCSGSSGTSSGSSGASSGTAVSSSAASGSSNAASSSGTPASSAASSDNTNEPEPAQGEEAGLKFSMPSGFYEQKIKLEITSEKSDVVICYTTDGTAPTEKSERYTEPIELYNRTFEMNMLSAHPGTTPNGDYVPSNVDKANVIRAAAFYPDGSRSEIISGTYFVGIDQAQKYAGVPIISMFTDKKNLFDYEKGIYVLGKRFDEWKAEDPKNQNLEGWQWQGNYSMRGKDWERPVTVEYFDGSGNSAFVQDMGMRIKGAASRSAAQKSLKLIAREEYGKKNVKYEVIPGNPRADGEGVVDKYKSFTLRNGGNDCDFAKIRDPFMQELVVDRRFETEQYCPVVAFIDGEYWGMYSLNEEYTDNYIENNYGIDSKNVVIVKRNELEEGEEGDFELYTQMYEFIAKNDMSNADNYKKAGEMLDLGSFADYCAFNLYINNEDSMFKDNNWEMWRVRTPDDTSPMSDGKWRMMVYDVDYSSGIYSDGGNFNQNNFKDALKTSDDEHGSKPVNMFVSLLKNDDFKREFVNALCDIRNVNFEKTAAVKRLNEVAGVYRKLVPDTFRRFGPDWVLWNPEEYFMQKIDGVKTYIEGRYKSLPGIMKKALELGEQATLSLSVADGGQVKLNASGVPISGSFSGVYFADCPITLKAESNGRKFVRWEGTGCTISDANAAETTVTFSGDFSVKAIFE